MGERKCLINSTFINISVQCSCRTSSLLTLLIAMCSSSSFLLTLSYFWGKKRCCHVMNKSSQFFAKNVVVLTVPEPVEGSLFIVLTFILCLTASQLWGIVGCNCPMSRFAYRRVWHTALVKRLSKEKEGLILTQHLSDLPATCLLLLCSDVTEAVLSKARLRLQCLTHLLPLQLQPDKHVEGADGKHG